MSMIFTPDEVLTKHRPVQQFKLEPPGTHSREFPEDTRNLGVGSKTARSTITGTELVQLPGGYSLTV